MQKSDEIMKLRNGSTGEVREINISQLVRDWHADAPGIGVRVGDLPPPAYNRVLERLGYASRR